MPKLSERLLGEVAVRQNFLSPPARDECYQLVDHVRGMGYAASLRETLVDKGFLTPAQLEWLETTVPLLRIVCEGCGTQIDPAQLGDSDKFLCDGCMSVISDLAGLQFVQADPAAVAAAAESDGSGGKQEVDLVGHVLGNCEITRKLGQGGMGVVYKARHVKLGVDVAVKVLPVQIAKENRAVIERFTREANVVSRIDHPNVVRVYEVGETDGYHFIVMQLIGGPNLSDFARGGKALEVDVGIDLLEQTLSGLAAAHKLQIIHRDIKPENIMLTTDATAKITDFGLARGLGQDSRLTQTGEVLGTPYYMSPEQSDSRPLDRRTDIYSLGCTFYQLLTGRLPFDGQNPLQIILKHMNEEATPPHQVNPAIPEALSRLILKMMAKQPDGRYASCEAVLEDLVRLKSGQKIESLTPIHIKCSHCARELEFMESEAGTMRQCKNCKATVWVPRPKSAPTVDLPHQDDIFFARVVVLNKMAAADKVVATLKKIAPGAPGKIAEGLVGSGVIKLEQSEMIEKAIGKELRKRDSMLAGKVILKNALATKEVVEPILARDQKAQAQGAAAGDGLVSTLMKSKAIGAATVPIIDALVDEYRKLQEDVLLGKLAVANRFATEAQVREGLATRRVRRQNPAQGALARLGLILLEKGYLDEERLQKVRDLAIAYLVTGNPPEVPVPLVKDLPAAKAAAPDAPLELL